jgi:hypothetical protein
MSFAKISGHAHGVTEPRDRRQTLGSGDHSPRSWPHSLKTGCSHSGAYWLWYRHARIAPSIMLKPPCGGPADELAEHAGERHGDQHKRGL